MPGFQSTFRQKSSAIDAPIKGYSHKGFVVGWIAIVFIVAAGFTLATRPLSHSGLDLRLANLEAIAASVQIPLG